MGRSLAGLLAGVVAAVALAAPPQPPSLLYPELFDAVQRSTIYPDSKTFADAIPKEDPAAIGAAYRRERGATGFDLRAFVARHFDEPEHAGSGFQADPSRNVCQHIDALWSALTRGPDAAKAGSSLLPLPHRYVVPGGRYREVYYWDSYFTMIGLEASGRHDLVVEMVDNFAHLIDEVGHIPNGNRTYYLSRSQPPFFAAMVKLVAQKDGDAVYAKYLPQMRKEHDFWMAGAQGVPRGAAGRRVVRLAGGELLNRYWDDRASPRDESYREDVETARVSGRPKAEVYRNLRAAAESGWDFSARWLTDGKTLATIHTADYLPPDLNALLYQLEVAISLGYAAGGNEAEARAAKAVADTRARGMRRILWNPARRSFTDYLWREKKPSELVTAAGMYPLYFDVATREQAAESAAALRSYLLRPGGIVPTPIASGQQWDAPNGWAPLQWIAIQGLARYGEAELSRAIAWRWAHENLSGYERDHKLVEKYDVEGAGPARDGEYPTQDGFGWTNGILRALMTPDCQAPAP
ncbi:MAG TPA: alpha,alpha-trehalase TreF [Steroidobacteraceae bacterium]|nr:alpha,alpha-trehalase TreF [Steroidobacteraceae bacterium]